MRNVLRFGGFAALFVSLLVVSKPGEVFADCGGGIAFPDSVGEVQGRTFVGIFNGVTGDFFNPVQHWTVEHVYAGDVPLGQYRYPAYSCHETHFSSGQRYLVSSGAQFTAWDTAAYQMQGAGQVQLIGFEGASPSSFPKALQVRALADALAVLLLPPTDGIAVAPAIGAAPVWPVGALLLGSLLLFGLHERRFTTD
jgi:hypothetical protein